MGLSRATGAVLVILLVCSCAGGEAPSTAELSHEPSPATQAPRASAQTARPTPRLTASPTPDDPRLVQGPDYCLGQTPAPRAGIPIHTLMPRGGKLAVPPVWELYGVPHFHPVYWASTGHSLLEAGRREDALTVADDLWSHQDDGWFLYDFDWPDESQTAPWRSAMAQGLALGLFARLRQLDRAAIVYATLAPGSPVVADDGWLLEYPGYSPVLNGAIFAIMGLYDYWEATGSEAVRRRLIDAIAPIARDIGLFRNPGEVSSYERADLHRHANYHAIHISQLHMLARIAGMPCFDRVADDLASDA